MSTIRVEQAHSLPEEDAKAALSDFAADISKFGMKMDWNGPEAVIKGPGASGSISIEANKVIVTVKLGMLAKAAGVKADRLEGSIARRLAKALSMQNET